MNNKKKIKLKAIFLLTTYIYIFNYFNNKKLDNIDNFQINNEFIPFEPYCEYSGGNIYIISSKSDEYQTNNGDIFIIDSRDSKNPNFKICKSYKIDNISQMKEILNILLELERLDPSEWDRTIPSMINEWCIHNICYNNGILCHRTSCVDMDNNDEKKYSLKLFKKVIN